MSGMKIEFVGGASDGRQMDWPAPLPVVIWIPVYGPSIVEYAAHPPQMMKFRKLAYRRAEVRGWRRLYRLEA